MNTGTPAATHPRSSLAAAAAWLLLAAGIVAAYTSLDAPTPFRGACWAMTIIAAVAYLGLRSAPQTRTNGLMALVISVIVLTLTIAGDIATT